MKRVFDLERLQKYNGRKIIIGGQVFTLETENYLFNKVAVWKGAVNSVYATPTSLSTIIEVYRNANDEFIGELEHENVVYSYDEYVEIVKSYVLKILNLYKEQQQIWGNR